MRRYLGLGLLFLTLLELACFTGPNPSGLLTNLGTRARRNFEFTLFAIMGTASAALLTSSKPDKRDPFSDA